MNNPFEGYQISEPRLRGEYTHSRNRVYVVYCKDGIKRTIAYPRYLLAVKLGRLLTKDEYVHHLDGNIKNNKLENLEIVSPKEHSQIHLRKHQDNDFTCPECNKLFTLTARQVGQFKRWQELEPGRGGPFCSHRCSTHAGWKKRWANRRANVLDS